MLFWAKPWAALWFFFSPIILWFYFGVNNNYLPNPLCLLCIQNSYYRFTPKFCPLFKWALSMLIPISYSIHFIFFPFNISATAACYVCLLACYTHSLRCSFMIILVFPFFPSGVLIVSDSYVVLLLGLRHSSDGPHQNSFQLPERGCRRVNILKLFLS